MFNLFQAFHDFCHKGRKVREILNPTGRIYQKVPKRLPTVSSLVAARLGLGGTRFYVHLTVVELHRNEPIPALMHTSPFPIGWAGRYYRHSGIFRVFE
jgi:hypothetical protein